jgi:hypothetical protein
MRIISIFFFKKSNALFYVNAFFCCSSFPLTRLNITIFSWWRMWSSHNHHRIVMKLKFFFEKRNKWKKNRVRTPRICENNQITAFFTSGKWVLISFHQDIINSKAPQLNSPFKLIFECSCVDFILVAFYSHHDNDEELEVISLWSRW